MQYGDYATALRRRGLALSTVKTRLACLSAFAAWLGRDVLSASAEEIERFLDGKRLGVRSRYNWISHLSNYYQWRSITN